MSSTQAAPGGATQGRLDPITFEVLRHSLGVLVDEMGLRLGRTAFTPVITQARDYSCAILDAEGRFVACGKSDMPIHLGTFEFTIRELRKSFGDDLNEGDILLFNDPYTGGTHNQDVKACRPVFWEGELVAWLLSMCHWPDIGGPVPGTFNCEARECYAEGLRIPPVKLFDRGVRCEWLVEMIFANLRGSEERRADLYGLIQSVFAGEERLKGLLAKYGKDTLENAYLDSFDHAERNLRVFTETLPNGTYEWTDWIDKDPADAERRSVKIHLELTIEDGELTFDFTKSDGTPSGAVGSTLPTTWSAALTSTLNLFPGIPLNHGLERVIHLKTVPGSVVHVLPPTPCSGMACASYDKLIACCLGSFGLASPELKAGCGFNLINLTLGGTDRSTGKQYVLYVYPMGGFGGTARGDAGLPTYFLYGPGARSQPVEVMERVYPLVFDEMRIRPDSAGAGLHRGSYGMEARFHLEDADGALTVLGDRQIYPIWGIEGGLNAGGQDTILNSGTEDERSVGMFVAGIPVDAPDEILLLSGGGGGYGDPLERDPELIVEDVKDELLTPERALADYGVVIDTVDPEIYDFRVNAEATDEERARRRVERAAEAV